MRLAIYFFVFVMALLPTVNLSAVTTVNQTTTGISVFGSETINNDDVKPKRKKKKKGKKGKRGGITTAKVFMYLFFGTTLVSIIGLIVFITGASKFANAPIGSAEEEAAAGQVVLGTVLAGLFGGLAFLAGLIWLIVALVNR